MPSPKLDQDWDAALWRAARDLSPAPVTAIELAGSGANSHVYHVHCKGADYALKQYPVAPSDGRDRISAEWRALSFLTRHGVDEVARPIARLPEGGFMLMEWIEGAPIDRHGPADLRQAIGFMIQGFELSCLPEARLFAPAAEACLSATSIIEQIDRRLNGFDSNDQLDRWLAEHFLPVYRKARDNALGTGWTDDLPAEKRRLIPADFGFHNALRTADGRLRYFDFDYFGWDDPVKLTADFILHPAMSLTPDEGGYMAKELAEALPGDKRFLPRLNALLPLYALRWSLILLNPFRVGRCPPGGAVRDDHERLLSRQLCKARRMTERASSLGVRFVLE